MTKTFTGTNQQKTLKIEVQKISAFFIAHDLEFWTENTDSISNDEVEFRVIPYLYFLENNIEIKKSNPLIFELNVARQASMEVQMISMLASKGYNCLVIKPSGDKKLDLPKLENMKTIEWPFSSKNLIASIKEFESNLFTTSSINLKAINAI